MAQPELFDARRGPRDHHPASGYPKSLNSFDTAPGYEGLIFTVAPARAYVTVGINRTADPPDPADLLEGAGVVHQHVKVRKVADQDVMIEAVALHG